MGKPLLEAIAASETDEAIKQFDQSISHGKDPWDIHRSLFSAVQSVLNPPFINPHLPKMYAVINEFLPYLEDEDIAPLVRIEIAEYARRPKLKMPHRPKARKHAISFNDIQTGISYRDTDLTAKYLYDFHRQKGAKELCQNLLLLGSEYLNHSLGHSVSCTAFILLEMLNRPKDDSWPVMACLADYFCKGGFDSFATTVPTDQTKSDGVFQDELMRASAGYGIVNLHHTITLYAIKRIQKLLTGDQYGKVLQAGVEFMGVKTPPPSAKIDPAGSPLSDYESFYSLFSKKDGNAVLPVIMAMTKSDADRKRLCRYLIKGVCDLYQGDYNPHYLTGLGSTLWIFENYWNDPKLSAAASDQYLDFFFQGI